MAIAIGVRADPTSSKKTGYEKLLHDDDTESDIGNEAEFAASIRSRSQRSKYRRWCVFVTKSAIMVLALWSFFAFGALSGSGEAFKAQMNPRESCNCGNSVEEALNKGCKWDSISASLLPAHCRDEELLEEFNHDGENPDGTWNYWKDPHKEVRLNDTGILEITAKVEPFYASYRWHLVHCVYYWRKLERKPRTKITLEQDGFNEGHIKHCQNVFLQRWPLDDIRTISGISLNGDEPRQGLAG